MNNSHPNPIMNGVYIKRNTKEDAMNNEIYQRNIPSKPVQMVFDPRQVQTRYVRFPMIDAKTPARVTVDHRGPYQQHGQFNPGSSAPYEGYATNIDQDSRVKNMYAANQKYTPQSNYIPSSHSELYNEPTIHNSKPYVNDHPLLFQQETFASFNPNPNHLGGNMLYNHTRQQVKNVKSVRRNAPSGPKDE